MIWLFGPATDLVLFLMPAVVALALVPFAPPSGELPLPGWVIAVLVVDVEHVWSTLFRTYLDPAERRRHRRIFRWTPLLAYLGALLLASISVAWFWTVLAYLAVFHFVRQQYGWVALCHKKAPPRPWERWLDLAAIHLATLVPLFWWHAHLPRNFDWFLPGDFVLTVPPWFASLLWIPYWAVLALFVARQLWLLSQELPLPITKVVVVLTTAACWGVGIVATNSDWSFTLTNVLIHGVPYLGLVWRYGKSTEHPEAPYLDRLFAAPWLALVLLLSLAWGEEWAWDRLFWHAQADLFPGPQFELAALTPFVLALLALPQLTHYVLDGFIWRTRRDPAVRRLLGS